MIKFFLIISSLFLFSCSEDKKKNSEYKKQSNIPSTGQSIDKKNSPGKKVGDLY